MFTMIQDAISGVSEERIERDLFYLCKDPLPFRKANYTRPGQHLNSLEEADLYITDQLESCGYRVNGTRHRVQAFRYDETKPPHARHGKPDPEDKFHVVSNLETIRSGAEHPEEIIQMISHKDSMSWIDSPGAHDNGSGTVANLELARVLSTCNLERSVRLLFCNEEHTPWTSRFAAQEAADREDRIIAVMNVDSLDGKSQEDTDTGRLTHVITYSTEEGRELAQFIAECGCRHGIELDLSVAYKEKINDDDGMFINAGFRATVMNIGSWPYSDPEYHLPGDTPDRVNIENIKRSTQLLVAAVLELDLHGWRSAPQAGNAVEPKRD